MPRFAVTCVQDPPDSAASGIVFRSVLSATPRASCARAVAGSCGQLRSVASVRWFGRLPVSLVAGGCAESQGGYPICNLSGVERHIDKDEAPRETGGSASAEATFPSYDV